MSLNTAWIPFCTGMWLLIWAVLAVRAILRKQDNCICFPLAVYFITFGVPAFGDAFMGPPAYFHYPGFRLAMQDDATNLVYYLFVNLVPVFWWITKPAQSQLARAAALRQFNATSTSSKLPRLIVWAGGLGLLSPIWLLPLAPNPWLYTSYATYVFRATTPQELFFNQFFQMSTLLSVFIAITILISAKEMNTKHLYLIPILAADIWINGKRFIVLLLVVFICFVIWQRGALRARTLVGSVLLLGSLAIGYSQLYQVTLRPYYQSQAVDKYEDFRLDVGRDHSLKTSIYSQLYDKQLLPYPLHSLVFYGTLFIPRSLWENKPFAYATYFTSYVFRSPVMWQGFGFTTTIFGEMIDNCSWWGLFFGPGLIAGICRLGDRSARNLVRMLAVSIASSLLILQLAGFLPVVAMWICLMLFDRQARRGSLQRTVTARTSLSGSFRRGALRNA